MFSIYYRKHRKEWAWVEGWRDDCRATCKTQPYAEELVRILNNNDGPGRELALASHHVRRAA